MSNKESFSSICKSLYDMPDIRAREVVRLYHEQIVEDVEFFKLRDSHACSFASYIATKAMEALTKLESSNIDGTFSLTITQLKCFLFIYDDKRDLLSNKELLLSGHTNLRDSKDNSDAVYIGLESLAIERGFFCWDYDTEIKPFIDKVGFFTLSSSYKSVPFDSSHNFGMLESPFADGTDNFASYSCSTFESIAVVSCTIPMHLLSEYGLRLLMNADNVKIFC